MREPTAYIQHYIDISEKYSSAADVYRESANEVKKKIREFVSKDHYKYEIYVKFNPELEKSPFIDNPNHLSGDIIRFRLGSHLLPIETGRWSRTNRADRLCIECGVLGDERHAIYLCRNVDRTNVVIPADLSDIWSSDSIFTLFKNFKNANILD